jgi:hypothetical protein
LPIFEKIFLEMTKRISSISFLALISAVISFSSCKKNDSTAPELTITGGNDQSQSLPSIANTGSFTIPIATATDETDGDLSAKVSYSGTVNPNLKGTYLITYSVSDNAGNITKQEVAINIVNDAEWLTGNFSAVDSVYNTSPVLSGLPFVTTYTGNPNEKISTDSYVNNKIWLSKFGNYTGANVYLMVSGTGAGATIDIPQQTTLCGNPSALRTFSDDIQNPAGTVFMNGTRPGFLLFYKEFIQANSSTANSAGRYYHD